MIFYAGFVNFTLEVSTSLVIDMKDCLMFNEIKYSQLVIYFTCLEYCVPYLFT